MPIARRNVSASDLLHAPASIPKVFKPSDKAVVAHLPAKNRMRAGTVLYEGTPVAQVPFDDLVALARTVANEGENLETAYRNRIKGRLSAIRAWCVLSKGSAKRVRSCENVACPLWAFRMGTNPYRRRK